MRTIDVGVGSNSLAIYFPDKKAFWDVKDFPQLKILEDNWEIIRDEALEAIQHFLVYFSFTAPTTRSNLVAGSVA